MSVAQTCIVYLATRRCDSWAGDLDGCSKPLPKLAPRSRTQNLCKPCESRIAAEIKMELTRTSWMDVSDVQAVLFQVCQRCIQCHHPGWDLLVWSRRCIAAWTSGDGTVIPFMLSFPSLPDVCTCTANFFILCEFCSI